MNTLLSILLNISVNTDLSKLPFSENYNIFFYY